MYAPLQCFSGPILKTTDSSKLQESVGNSNSAITSHISVFRLITAEVSVSQIISCQKVLELQQNEFCLHLREF